AISLSFGSGIALWLMPGERRDEIDHFLFAGRELRGGRRQTQHRGCSKLRPGELRESVQPVPQLLAQRYALLVHQWCARLLVECLQHILLKAMDEQIDVAGVDTRGAPSLELQQKTLISQMRSNITHARSQLK